ncbi:hypothetical protein GCM10010193_58170 [Kitasatospora atroaurantiaca]
MARWGSGKRQSGSGAAGGQDRETAGIVLRHAVAPGPCPPAGLAPTRTAIPQAQPPDNPINNPSGTSQHLPCGPPVTETSKMQELSRTPPSREQHVGDDMGEGVAQ